MNQQLFLIKTLEEDYAKVENFLTQTFGKGWDNKDVLRSYRFKLMVFNEGDVLSERLQQQKDDPKRPLLFSVTGIENFKMLLAARNVNDFEYCFTKAHHRYYFNPLLEIHELVYYGPVVYHHTKAETAIKILKNMSILFNRPDCFKDDFDTKFYEFYIAPEARSIISAEKFASVINQSLVSFRIFCTARNSNIPSMWTHYAENHQGVIFGFSTRKSDNDADLGKDNIGLFSHKECHSVIYADQSFYIDIEKAKKFEKLYTTRDASLSDWITEEIIIPLVRTKARHWAYEQELRIVDSTLKENSAGLAEATPDAQLKHLEKKFPQKQIRRIILGKNIDSYLELELFKLIKQNALPIVIRKVIGPSKNYGYKTKVIYNGPKELTKKIRP